MASQHAKELTDKLASFLAEAKASPRLNDDEHNSVKSWVIYADRRTNELSGELARGVISPDEFEKQLDAVADSVFGGVGELLLPDRLLDAATAATGMSRKEYAAKCYRGR